MKRVIILAIVILSAMSLRAEHEYIPFVEEGKVWVEYDYQANYYQMGISGTTIIDDKEYHNLYMESFNWWGGQVNSTTASVSWGYIREENRRVYIRESIDREELLIYDFGIQVGDTIEWRTDDWDSDEICIQYIVLDSIKQQTYYGKERSVYYVTGIKKGYAIETGECMWSRNVMEDVWIEGVGSQIISVMYVQDDRFRWGATGMLWCMYCYNYNTQEIFPTTSTPYTVFSYPGSENGAGAVDAVYTPSYLTLHRSGDVVVAVFPAVGAGDTITLYDSAGRVVASKAIREGATTTSIGIGTLPGGIYIARLTNGATAKIAI